MVVTVSVRESSGEESLWDAWEVARELFNATPRTQRAVWIEQPRAIHEAFCRMVLERQVPHGMPPWG